LEQWDISLSVDNAEGYAPHTISFTCKIESENQPYTFLYDFGDGTPISILQNEVHTYTYSGTYTASIKVTDLNGNTATKTQKIIVSEVPNQTPGVSAAVTVAVNVNQSEYQVGDQLRLDVTANGNELVDLYVIIIFPGGSFQSVLYPLNFSMINAVLPYQSEISISDEQIFPILDVPLPQGIQKGTYSCYGLVMIPGSDPWDVANWINYAGMNFEFK